MIGLGGFIQRIYMRAALHFLRTQISGKDSHTELVEIFINISELLTTLQIASNIKLGT